MLLKKKISISLISIVLIVFGFAASILSFQECEINATVKDIMNEMSIENCKVYMLCDYSDITYVMNTPQVREEEVGLYVDAIKTEHGVQYIDEKFVKNELGFSSVELFYESISSKLLEQKKVEKIGEAREFVMKELIKRSKFHLDEQQVASYALEIVNSYEMEANLYNMSMEDYCIQILKVPYENIFDICYEEAEYYVKTYLIIGAVMYAEYGNTFEFIEVETENDLYKNYQTIENEFYNMFIHADADF